MNTFYSIVSATINPITNESVSLGLLLSNGKESRYAFSVNRLSLVKNLVSMDQYKFIKDYLKSFHTIIEKYDNRSSVQTGLESLKENLVINEPYISYLSTYSRNLVKVSSPVKIDLVVNETNFHKLYIKFIDMQDQIHTKIKKSIMQIKDDFTEEVNNHFTPDRELTITEFPSLELPVTVDLFGRNERIVIVQFVDLERQINFIKTDLYDLEHVDQVIEMKTIFLVTQEPNIKAFSQQHHLWQQTRKDDRYDYIDLKEVERIQEYAREHGVVPN